MKKKIIFLCVVLLTMLLSSCTKDEVIIQEQEYPLDNHQLYQLEGSPYHFNIIYFEKNVFRYKGKMVFSCNYKYVHPIVTLILSNDTTYQFYVGENYLKLQDKEGKDHFFYAKEKNW